MKQCYSVGIIGAGLRGAFVLGARMAEMAAATKLRVHAICDKLPSRMAEAQFYLQSLYQKQGVTNEIRLYTDYHQLIDDPDIDLVLITTPTYFHSAPCIYALQAKKKVYLDKPIAVELEDSASIIKAEAEFHNPILMGFTRRYENSWLQAFSLLQQGTIGTLQMMQIRSVIPYTRYYHLWHRRNQWSGGALNDKASHHFDVFNWFAGENCKSISAIGGQSSIFTSTTDAPERCLNCKRECPYNIFQDEGLEELDIETIPPSWTQAESEVDRADNCVYAPGADITDHAICNLLYENGINASLFFCIFGPNTDDQETLELVGSKGRMILCRHTGIIDIATDYGKKRERLDTRTAEFSSSHFGGDRELIREMERFVDGKQPIVSAQNGYQSLRMIIAAQQSIDSNGKLIPLEALPDV